MVGLAVRVPGDDRLVVDDPHDAAVAGDEAVLPSALRVDPLGLIELRSRDPLPVAGVNAVDPEVGIGHPLLGRVAEQVGDLRADEVPSAVPAHLGDVDHARDALDHGPVLRLGHGQLVGELALTTDHALTVAEEDGLTREGAHDDEAEGDGRGDPQRTAAPASACVQQHDHEDGGDDDAQRGEGGRGSTAAMAVYRRSA